jgi:Tfp pilus assembly protein PilV
MTSLQRISTIAVLLFVMAHAMRDPARADAPAQNQTLPPALEQLRDFRGTISYVAHREGAGSGDKISGTFSVSASGWSLDETTASYALHADAGGSTIALGGQTLSIDDLFDVQPLANAWAAVLASLADGTAEPVQDGGAWTVGSVRIYLNAEGDRMVGLVDDASRNRTGFVFDDWTDAGPLLVPGRIMRLRDGVPDTVYRIEGYTVAMDPAEPGGGLVAVDSATQRDAAPALTLAGGFIRRPAAGAALEFTALCCALLAGMFGIAWTRRDAMIAALCRRLARDPRGWRRAGVSLFVGPDGAMYLDGIRYRVGPHFYGRAALVQCSILFIRVSAPAVPHAVILPRRFRPIDLGIRPAAKRQAAGFTLVEAVVATALFAAIVVLGIYPALVTLARADALAEQRSLAAQIAANALADEEAAYAYSAGAQLGSTTALVDGLTLTVTVQPGFTRFADDLDIDVTDASNAVLAHVASALGPPVKPPQ